MSSATIDHTPDRDEATDNCLVEKVVTAAMRAWKMHGEQPEISRVPVAEGSLLTVLLARRARRLEFFVEKDDPAIWESLASLDTKGLLQLCALVPLGLSGTARVHLYNRGFELQNWWLDGGKVAFRSVEAV